MSEKFKNLIEYFSRLPGIGPRQATRLVLAMLNWPDDKLAELASSIETLKQGSIFCKVCFNLSDNDTCYVCSDPKRNQNNIAVVEKITDLVSMEKTGAYKGIYHVLGGTINPADGMLPDKLRIAELTQRVRDLSKEKKEAEIILATSHTTHGDTTALYLEEALRDFPIKITRLARGLASGATLEYTDEKTLTQALKHRK